MDATTAPRNLPGRTTSRREAHAVVIGSGFGGLAAAVRLGARGYRVTVLEGLDAPGGRAYVHHQDGFKFDAGPTIITAPFLLEELWRLAGRQLSDDIDLRPLMPFYRLMFHDGESIDWSNDLDAMRRELTRIAPGDVAGYERFMHMSEAIYRVGFQQLGHTPFGSWLDMAKVAPALIRLQSYRTLHSLVASYVRHPKLRFALSFHPLFVGGNPFTTTAVYGLIAHLERSMGVHFVMGGTGRLVTGLTDLIASQGNEVRCKAPVEAITVSGRRVTGVRLASGTEIRADVVVSDADPAMT